MQAETHAEDRAGRFVRLLAANEKRLGGFVLSLVPNWADAEDILQETKLRLWEQFDAYDAEKDFGAWACTIARYQVLTARTLAERSKLCFSPTFLDRVEDEAVRAAEDSEIRLRFLQQCIDKLTQWQRDLLRRCCLANDSIQKVSDELGRKVDSTRKALLRIRGKLFRCIEDAMQEEERR